MAPLLSGILRGESEGVRPLYRRSEIGTPELKIVGEEGQLGEGRRARALGVEGVDAQVGEVPIPSSIVSFIQPPRPWHPAQLSDGPSYLQSCPVPVNCSASTS